MTHWIDEVDWMIVAIVGVVLLLLGGLGYAYSLESQRWEAFKVAQSCVVIGKADGDVFNTFSVGANGQMSVGIGSTPGKTGWKCSDGITYWKAD